MAVIALETHDNHVVAIRTSAIPTSSLVSTHTETPKHDVQRGTYQEPMMGDSRIGLTVRAAEVADFDAVQAIFVRASLTNADDREALLASPHVLEPTPDRIMQKRILVAVADKGELADLFVDPSMMRHGVASQFVQATVTEAPASDSLKLL
jgi:GNAT superfamily N-acetyltransferase